MCSKSLNDKSDMQESRKGPDKVWLRFRGVKY